MFDVQDKSWVVETNYHIPENKDLKENEVNLKQSFL